MSYVGVKFNNAIRKIAGMAIMDVAFSNTSINGVQNKVIKAKFDEVEDELTKGRLLATVNFDGVKTNKQALNELKSVLATLTGDEALRCYIINSDDYRYNCIVDNAIDYEFSCCGVFASSVGYDNVLYKIDKTNDANTKAFTTRLTTTGLTVSDLSDTVPPSGSFRLYI